MTQVTDAMVEAACNKEYELVQHWPLRGEERFVYMNKPNMRAVLTAALSAAESPTPMVAFALNVELKSLQDEVDAALRDGNSYVAEGLIAQERALQATIRQQISLAVADASLRTNDASLRTNDASLRSNAEPPTPGDAEFEAALNEYVGKQIAATRVEANTHRWGGQTPSETEYGKAIITEANVARARVLDLHRRARMAGDERLRELRAWLGDTPYADSVGDASSRPYVLAAGRDFERARIATQIDAMLQGADGEGAK